MCLKATFLWWSSSASGSVKFSLMTKCLYMMPVFLSISDTSSESDCPSTTIHNNGGGTSLIVLANLLKNTPWYGSSVLIGVTIIASLLGSNLGFGSSSFSKNFAGSDSLELNGVGTGLSAIKLLLTLLACGVLATCWCNISTGCDLFDATTWLEKIEALPPGAKPVKKPITKHKPKWTIAFFHNWTFFFDLSKDPI